MSPEPFATRSNSQPLELPNEPPPPYPGEPGELTDFRSSPVDEAQFLVYRRQFRDAQDWRALAHLLLIHANALELEESHHARAADMMIQAHELFFERAADTPAAIYALSRAVRLRPDLEDKIERLEDLYVQRGARAEQIALLRWRAHHAKSSATAARIHWQLARLLEDHCGAISEAVTHYRRVTEMDPNNFDALDALVELYTRAGAWDDALTLIQQRLELLDPERDGLHVAQLLHRSAVIEAYQRNEISAAASHLKTALDLVPSDIDTLVDFGELYAASHRSGSEGASKAASVFFKAAELARQRQDHARALRLLRRCLQIQPEHSAAASALERVLIATEDWIALDELLESWLTYAQDPETIVSLQLRRARLLEQRLERTEDARLLYEDVALTQSPWSSAWRRLEAIYEDARDYDALAELLDTQAEYSAQDVDIDTLLRIAELYRDKLGLEERAAVYFYKVLERDPFNIQAFEGYKEHWRRKRHWSYLRELILYQIEQALADPTAECPLPEHDLAAEFIELADIIERRLGDVDEALEIWEQARLHFPTDPRPPANIARIEKRTRMWDSMVRLQEAELERATEPNKRLEVLKRLTQVYRDRQINAARAMTLYHEILELAPNDASATRALIALYDRAGEYERVVTMLREQYNRTGSQTERISLLRRMAELWHHELDAPDDAIWACREILEAVPADVEAMARWQQLLEEQERWRHLYDLLEREYRTITSTSKKITLLRRMTRLAERELGDDALAIATLERLHNLQPTLLDIVDHLAHLYATTERWSDLKLLLERVRLAPTTPPIRRTDFNLQLAVVADRYIEETELAQTCYEVVLEMHPSHRGALDALVNIYRQRQAWRPLVDTLGRLEPLLESPDELTTIVAERVEIFIKHLNDPGAAAATLATHAGPRQSPDTPTLLLSYYRQAEQHRNAIRQAELLLLSTSKQTSRRDLYTYITETWRDALNERMTARATWARYLDEAPGDIDAWGTMARLHESVDAIEAAIVAWRQRHDRSEFVRDKLDSLEHIATLQECSLEQPRAALSTLQEALTLEPLSRSLANLARELVDRHDLWKPWFETQPHLYAAHRTVNDADGQIDVALEAAQIAVAHLDCPDDGFEWTRRAYFVAIEAGLPHQELLDRLEALALDHQLWTDMLGAIQDEIAALEHRDPEYAPVKRLLAAVDIAEVHLEDPALTVRLLQQAHARAPKDVSLTRRLEDTATRYGQWDPVLDLYRERWLSTTDDVGRLAAAKKLASIHELELDDPHGAFDWLEQASRHVDGDEAALQLVELSHRHRLWSRLARHYLENAIPPTSSTPQDATALAFTSPFASLAALHEAARVFRLHLERPLEAMQTLVKGLSIDAGGQQSLPELVAAADDADDTDEQLGSLALLQALEWALDSAPSAAVERSLLVERAQVREQRLNDPQGAMLEWIRVIEFQHQEELKDVDEATEAIERLARAHECWLPLIAHLAIELERASSSTTRRDLWLRLARAYEEVSKLEYALRARIAAWQCIDPETRPQSDPYTPLDRDHADMWRLAQAVASYEAPPLPKDPFLHPTLRLPEPDDLDTWIKAGFDPEWLRRWPRPPTPSLETRELIEDVQLSEIIIEDSVSLDDSTELELEDLDLIEIPPIPADDPLEHTQLSPAPRHPGIHPLPSWPELTRPVLPTRPAVSSGWDELALAYTHEHLPATWCSRMWEVGAHQLEPAFDVLVEDCRSLGVSSERRQHLEDLAARHQADEQLATAYETLHGEAKDAATALDLARRAAVLFERVHQTDRAEPLYRTIIELDPDNVEALSALARYARAETRWADYVRWTSHRLELDPALAEADRAAQILELAELEARCLDRPQAAIERLTALVTQCPNHRAGHQALCDQLLTHQAWQPAIEAMQVAIDVLDDSDLRQQYLGRIAVTYEVHLDAPELAIPPWEQLQAHGSVLADHELQRLYFRVGRYTDAIGLLSKRCKALNLELPDELAQWVALEVELAQLCLDLPSPSASNAPDEVIARLERVCTRAPESMDATLTLICAYAHANRGTDAVALAHRYTGSESCSEPIKRHVLRNAAEALAQHEASELAIALITLALDITPEDDQPLYARRAELANVTGNDHVRAESLAHLHDLDAQLEAMHLWRTTLNLPDRALAQLEAILAATLPHPDDPQSDARVDTCIDALVEILVPDDLPRARALLLHHLDIAPANSSSTTRLLIELGRIESILDHPHDALTMFERALALAPNNPRAKAGYGATLLSMKRVGEAIPYLAEAADALQVPNGESERVETLLVLATAHATQQQFGDAYRRLQSAQRLAPTDLRVRVAMVENRHNAGRHRETINAVDQLDELLQTQAEDISPATRGAVAKAFEIAGEAERALDHHDRVIARYRRSIGFNPTNRRLLAQLVALNEARGTILEAAGYAKLLAEQTEDPIQRGVLWISAGILALEADDAVASSDQPPLTSPGEAVHAFQTGLETLGATAATRLPSDRFELAFGVFLDHDMEAGLGWLERHGDDSISAAVWLRAADAALNRTDPKAAERYAMNARRIAPDSGAALLLLARIYESTHRIDALEQLVEGASGHLDETARFPIGDQVKLLLRLAELKTEEPEQALKYLERAVLLHPSQVPLAARQTLNHFYQQLGATHSLVRDNLHRIVERDPLDRKSLVQLANIYRDEGDAPRYEALLDVANGLDDADEPEPEAQALASIPTYMPPARSSSTGPNDIFDPIFEALWDGGQEALAALLPRIEPPESITVRQHVSDPIGSLWVEANGSAKEPATMVRASQLPWLPPIPDGSGPTELVFVRCQHPTLVIVRGDVSTDPDAMRFALLRAALFCQPTRLFAVGITRAMFTQLMSALLMAFHPRHLRRKHRLRSDDPTLRLAQELTRRLPSRLIRQIELHFKHHEHARFDSAQWRQSVRQTTNREALQLSGNLKTALSVLVPSSTDPASSWRERARADADVSDLLAFTCTAEFATARANHVPAGNDTDLSKQGARSNLDESN